MKRSIVLLLAGLALAGCTLDGAREIADSVAVSDAYRNTAPSPSQVTAETRWWEAFGDPVLNGLVNEALAENLTLAQARERVAAARAQARINGSGALPEIEASAQARAAGQKTADSRTTSRTTTLGLSAAWLINPAAARLSRQADEAAIRAERYQLDLARMELVAEIADTWLTAQGLARQEAIARSALAVQRQTAELTQAKFDAGSTNALDVTRARAATASTSADIPSLEQDRAQAVNRIAVLLGREPSRLDLGRIPAHRVRAPRINPGTGIPADLLRNRPDVRVAEEQLKQAVAAIGIRETQLWPSLTLTGSLQVSRNTVSTTSWGFGPSLTVPLFDRGALHAGVDLAKSDARGAYLAWKQSVIVAVGEVENAMVAWRQEQVRRSRLAAAVGEYQTALSLARQLYQSGATNFLDVLDAQSSLYDAQQRLAQSDLAVARNYVALCRALGGGWSGEPA